MFTDKLIPVIMKFLLVCMSLTEISPLKVIKYQLNKYLLLNEQKAYYTE